MRKLWGKYHDYNFFRPYIVWAVRTSFSKITVEGADNVPDPRDVSVIFASNHCNTLMDPLVLLQARRDPIAFVARADIFKKPFFAHLLNNLRILPVYRKRDGEGNADRNKAIFDNVVECLNHGVAFSIAPEGTHRARRSLMPVKHGIFHIAQQAVNSNPSRPVRIVPVGIDYDDYFNIMRPVTLRFGEPMDIVGGEPMEDLSSDLYKRISSLITFFPDDENLDAAEKAFNESRRHHYGMPSWILAALLLPIFILSGFLCLPMLIAAAFFSSKLKDKAWLNTMRFACKLALTPFTVAGALTAGLIHLPWSFAILLAIATLYAHPVFYKILVFYRYLFHEKSAN